MQAGKVSKVVRRALTGAAAALLAALALAPGAGAVTRSCGWAVQFSPDQVNALFPDQAARYWVAAVPLPTGAQIEIHGQFPHARYTSLSTYTAATQAIDSLHDTQIVPDPGSSNPFLAGADRTVAKRSYTVKIVPGQVPAGVRPQNTLYTTNADGSKSSTGFALFALRIYEADLGTGLTGEEPLPTITLVLPSGQRIAYPDCPDTHHPDLGTTQIVAASGAGFQQPAAGGVTTTDPPAWHKYTNAATVVVTGTTDNEITGSSAYPALSGQTDSRLPSGGFGENIDNKYVYTGYGAEFGQVLVLHAKAPTFPHTGQGQTVMGTGQLRYWSLCAESWETTAFYGCLNDDQIPTDSRGYYTVAISTAAARPANATGACGVAWLPGPEPRTMLLMRNMLPSPTFKQAIQNVRVGHERHDMGAYYPAGRYYATTADFEAKGCHPATARR